jgi:2-oxoglutarate ferredoxin oxidoreductase subunit delta
MPQDYLTNNFIKLKGEPNMPKMTVDPNYCKGCGLCIAACPKKIIRFSEKINSKGYHYAECFDEEACIACKLCYTTCPDVAITIEK